MFVIFCIARLQRSWPKKRSQMCVESRNQNKSLAAMGVSLSVNASKFMPYSMFKRPASTGNETQTNSSLTDTDIYENDGAVMYDDTMDYDDFDQDPVLTTPLAYDTEMEYDTETSPEPSLGIRGEEVAIVMGIMLLWIGAIALFFNRWGKIRMLEPYQPKFCEEHRPSCPISESSMPQIFPKSFSKLNLLTEENPHYTKIRTGDGTAVGGLAMSSFGIPTGVLTSNISHHNRSPYVPSAKPMRLRQNSLFSPYAAGLTTMSHRYHRSQFPRRTKSAIDLPSLILSEEFFENVSRNSKNLPVTPV